MKCYGKLTNAACPMKRYHQTTTNRQALVMAFADITEDNISELMKSKDSKSTQRAVTRSIELFRDFLILTPVATIITCC
jgi:hypothetical protein